MRSILIFAVLLAGFFPRVALTGTLRVDSVSVPALAAQTEVPGGSVVATGASTPSNGLPERTAPARMTRAYWHVFIAFSIAWMLLFGYVLLIGKRFGALEEEAQRLRDNG
ncbi:MAG: CcmD family protein [Gemmatimonadota bacterium]|jgi:CcmD family protein|nr:CcmD family protein [Gemmatimonadota bacterium]